MSHDPAQIAESRALGLALDEYPSLAALRASPEWPTLAARLARLLAAVRRTEPAARPCPPRDSARVKCVHWNIEHGNRFEQILAALTTHRDLRDADLVLLNEADVGMARSGNRDVVGELGAALGLHTAWAPLFLETTHGRDDDHATARDRHNEEALFGLGMLSRFPIGAVRVIELPSPEAFQFDVERMYGRHIALAAGIERPGAPFLAVSTHLEVHRTRAHRAAQMRALLDELRDERRPIVLGGDFNTHTFDRGLWHSPLSGAIALMMWPGGALAKRLSRPDRGPVREPLFDDLRRAGFEWEPFCDGSPTLQLRFERLAEVRTLPRPVLTVAQRALDWAERRGRLRLDWIAVRGFRGGRGFAVHGLDGPGRASDHAPLVAELT